jgi:Fungal Zn(2)-Cys(6) binuclear cluster domain
MVEPSDHGKAMETEADVLGPLDSAGENEDNDGSPSAQTPEVGSDSAPAMNTRRRPVPSKGHRKSRKGCFPCKRRKVKCSEQLPVCRDCSRMDLVCEYPAQSFNPPASSLSSLQMTTKGLKYEDLRFFHHFLAAGLPAQPYGGNEVWVLVAAMSHEVRLHAKTPCPLSDPQ